MCYFCGIRPVISCHHHNCHCQVVQFYFIPGSLSSLVWNVVWMTNSLWQYHCNHFSYAIALPCYPCLFPSAMLSKAWQHYWHVAPFIDSNANIIYLDYKLLYVIAWTMSNAAVECRHSIVQISLSTTHWIIVCIFHVVSHSQATFL